MTKSKQMVQENPDGIYSVVRAIQGALQECRISYDREDLVTITVGLARGEGFSLKLRSLPTTSDWAATATATATRGNQTDKIAVVTLGARFDRTDVQAERVEEKVNAAIERVLADW